MVQKIKPVTRSVQLKMVALKQVGIHGYSKKSYTLHGGQTCTNKVKGKTKTMGLNSNLNSTAIHNCWIHWKLRRVFEWMKPVEQ